MKKLNMKFLNERTMKKLVQKKRIEMARENNEEKYELFRNTFASDFNESDSCETIEFLGPDNDLAASKVVSDPKKNFQIPFNN